MSQLSNTIAYPDFASACAARELQREGGLGWSKRLDATVAKRTQTRQCNLQAREPAWRVPMSPHCPKAKASRQNFHVQQMSAKSSLTQEA